VGVGGVVTVIVVVVLTAHCPAFGVNVYVVVAVLFIAGDHVPVTPFVEVVGKAGIAVPEQKGPTGLKVGVTPGVTLTQTSCVNVQPKLLVVVYVKH
jgi:hypothetical protein